MEENFIYESDVQDYFFHKLVAAGLAPEAGDLEVISGIVFDFLIDIGVLNGDEVEYLDEDDE